MAGDIDRLQAHEDDHGYVRAFLALARTQDGGRRAWIASGYRSCWDVSRAGDQSLLADAPLLIEEAGPLDPGQSAIVRLHPLSREYWADVAPGMVLGMFEGSRRVGEATVLDVSLRDR
jgi:hypothetical protein